MQTSPHNNQRTSVCSHDQLIEENNHPQETHHLNYIHIVKSLDHIKRIIKEERTTTGVCENCTYMH